ncbi:MAG: hypothetical protein JWM95_729 [Gemmatimonadetes bacterium]|nr:hypothetical protein [Gemmatimonadota bacterium]
MMPTSVRSTVSLDGVPPTTEAMLILALVWPSFEPEIRCYAEKLSKAPDDQDDLVQVALIALWRSDPTAYDLLLRDDVAYLRSIMMNRMRDVYGRHRLRLAKLEAEAGPGSEHSRRIAAEETDFTKMSASHLRALVTQIQEA